MSKKVSVRVKTMVKEEFVREVDGKLEVGVSVPPVDGKANDRIIELLAEYFKVPKSRVILRFGHKSKNKVFEIV